MTKTQAYLAVFAFLDSIAVTSGSDYMETVVSSMQLMSDGTSVDRALADSWIGLFSEYLGPNATECTDDEAFFLCLAYIKELLRSNAASELSILVSQMEGPADDKNRSDLKDAWVNACSMAKEGQVNASLTWSWSTADK